MKFLHLADLHLGKRVNEIPMLAEQENACRQILALAREEKPQAVLLAGDIYDKPTPAAEAVQLFDWFLTELAGIVPSVLIIAGNHDWAERLAFAAQMLNRQGVYIAPPFRGEVTRVELADEFGSVDFWLLPFVKPLLVRRCYDDAVDVADYDAAVARIMREICFRPGARNVLLAHQLITGSQTCESEELAIGGLDNVDAARFAGFDYVALGHLHGAQRAGGMTKMRYAGSPLKYSFSEVRQVKSVTLVELGADGSVSIDTKPITPLHDMREIRGTFATLTDPAYVSAQGEAAADYLHIVLTDAADVLDAALRLNQVYPNLMKLDYDNARTRAEQTLFISAQPEGKRPLQLFEEFYHAQTAQELTEEQRELIAGLIEEIWEEGDLA